MPEHRPVHTVDLYDLKPPHLTRSNVRKARDKVPFEPSVLEIVGAAILGLVATVLAILIMTGRG